MANFKEYLEIKQIESVDNASAWTVKPIQITDQFIDTIKTEVAQCYLPITTFEELYKKAGMESVFNHLRGAVFPKKDKVRDGNFGEILCQTYIKSCTDYEIPVSKLRYRFTREPSAHGEDVVGFIFRDDGRPDALLLAESKLRDNSVTSAIKDAHKSIDESINSQKFCFILHQIIAILERDGDMDKCRRINTMLTDYHGKKFEKAGGIFVVAKAKHWKDTHFVDHIENNTIDPLLCWAFVVENVQELIDRTH